MTHLPWPCLYSWPPHSSDLCVSFSHHPVPMASPWDFSSITRNNFAQESHSPLLPLELQPSLLPVLSALPNRSFNFEGRYSQSLDYLPLHDAWNIPSSLLIILLKLYSSLLHWAYNYCAIKQFTYTIIISVEALLSDATETRTFSVQQQQKKSV